MSGLDAPIITVKDIKYFPVNGKDVNAIRLGTNDVKVNSDEATVPSNIFIGHGAGASHADTFTSSIFIGKNSGYSATGEGNTGSTGGVFIGVGAGQSSTATNGNVFIGNNAGIKNTIGADNVAIGNYTGSNNVTGNNNSYIGNYAGQGFQGGTDTNIAIGYNSQSVGSFVGDTNIVVGSNSNLEGVGDNNIMIGTNSTMVGDPTGSIAFGNDILTNGDNVIAIGNGVQENAPNTIAIGGPSHTAMYIGAGGNANTSVTPLLADVYFNANATFPAPGGCTLHNATVVAPSDVRLKSEIVENVQGLSFINKLRPVTYLMHSIPTLGMIAQEVEQTARETGFSNFDGVIAPKNETNYYEMNYSAFITPLIKAVQDLSVQITELSSLKTVSDNEVASLKTQIGELKTVSDNEVASLKTQITELKTQIQTTVIGVVVDSI